MTLIRSTLSLIVGALLTYPACDGDDGGNDQKKDASAEAGGADATLDAIDGNNAHPEGGGADRDGPSDAASDGAVDDAGEIDGHSNDGGAGADGSSDAADDGAVDDAGDADGADGKPPDASWDGGADGGADGDVAIDGASGDGALDADAADGDGGPANCLYDGTYLIPVHTTTCAGSYSSLGPPWNCAWGCGDSDSIVDIVVANGALTTHGFYAATTECSASSAPQGWTVTTTPYGLTATGGIVCTGLIFSPSGAYSLSVNCQTGVMAVSGNCMTGHPDPCGFSPNTTITTSGSATLICDNPSATPTRCHGSTPQFCSAGHQWQDVATGACAGATPLCQDGVCVASASE